MMPSTPRLTCLPWATRAIGMAVLSLTTAAAVQAQQVEKLTIAEDVVVKFGSGAELNVRSSLQTGSGVVLTSLADDSEAGRTGSAPAVPSAGDWKGIRVDKSVALDATLVRGLAVRYAETALHVAGGVHQFEYLLLESNQTGVSVAEAAQVGFLGLILHDNGTGLQSSQDSVVVIDNSDISGNGFGVLNLSPGYVIDARNNWWGSANGPTASDNPVGDGDAVSQGVNYGQYLTEIPLLDCSVAVADGQYTVTLPEVELALACGNAVEYRLSPSTDFGTIPFVPMAATATFTLQPPPGAKQIHAEYRAATGNSVVVALPTEIDYQPSAPVVSITAPNENAEIVADTLIQAVATAGTGIDRVEFFVGSTLIGTDTQTPYEQLWVIDGFAVGDYRLQVIAYSTSGESAQATRNVRLRPGNVDPAAPTISDVRFAGVPLASGDSLSSPGTLQFTATAPSGVVLVEARIDGTLLPGSYSNDSYSAWLDFAAVTNGDHSLTLHAVNGFEVATDTTLAITVAVDPPTAPILATPPNGSTVTQPGILVSGTAQSGSQVQVYLDGVAVGGRILANELQGGFSTTVALGTVGTHSISVDAQNNRGTGPMSPEHLVTYTAPAPEIVFTSPQADAIVATDTDLRVAIVDPSGIVGVKYLLDGNLLATVNAPPWAWHWPIAAVPNGPHTLTAQATNVAGLSAQAEVDVTVQKQPPPPPPTPTPYIGELISTSPATSFGDQPIVIEGRAVERYGTAAVGNAVLHIVLENNGYQRTIGVATDADGGFTYTFQPAATDAGTYQVSVRHPEQADPTWQGQFTIDRVYLAPSNYRLLAARTVSASIPVTISTSTGNGVTGLRFEAPPSEQPSGSMPSGIDISLPEPVSLGSDASRVVSIGFLGSNAAPPTGTVVLVAYAQGSGGAIRGRVTLNFELHDPVPALVPSPNSLQGGLAQGEQLILSTQLSNQGLLPAQGVTVQLRNGAGTGPAPDWLQLGSPAEIGELAIGESQPVQVIASPGSSVSDGVHQATLRVTATNTPGGDIPIAVSVTQSGQGGASFHVSDIYTQTLDADGNPILGVANASVHLQHETIPSIQADATSDTNGVALFQDLPAGHYLWHATAPDHGGANGTISIQPGVSMPQEVFLDQSLVTVEWEVTETTIPDYYEVVVEATYETQVPAPVVIVEPMFTNLPPLQAGEIYSGQLEISNYGLVRADNFEFTPPADSAYLDFEFIGEVPDSLDAMERITLTYRITALQALPDGGSVPLAPTPNPWLQVAGKPTIWRNTITGGSCLTLSADARVNYDFQCANGSQQSGAGGTTWGYAVGQCPYSSGTGGDYEAGGTGGPPVGGWEGGGGGGGSSLPGLPACMPNCETCCKGGDSSGGG